MFRYPLCGLLLSSPGAALAAHGARGAVALLHDHADVGFHELGHVHHLPRGAKPHMVTSFHQVKGPSLNTRRPLFALQA